ncbi:hypothetical protein [Pseudoalteromonas gelatinilytica]
MLMTDGEPWWDVDQNKFIEDLYQSIYGTLPEAIERSHLPSMATILHGKDKENRDLYPATKVIDGANVFTIGFGKGLKNSAQTILQATADNGGGSYIFAESAEELSKAFSDTLASIRKVNSTFSSPAVASNNTDKLSHRDAVYFPMFLPSNGARWRGNLKKLKVSAGVVIDADMTPALESNGAISSGARTYWQPEDRDADGADVRKGGVNSFLSKQNSIPYAAGRRAIFSNLHGDILRHFSGWNAITYFGSVEKAAAAFDAIGANRGEIYDLAFWSRGVDVYDENNDGSKRDTREDVFGDPLHSKPVTIDYGNNDIRILIGTNAGYMHMFQDKDDILKESWAFIPRSLYKIIKPLRDNKKKSKVYGVDGPITVYFDDKNSDGVVNGIDRVWTFFGLRRGGMNIMR